MKLQEIDLTDPDLYASGDPHAVWRQLRGHAPVFWQSQDTGPGFWALTRYADVLRVSCDPGTFISAGGTSTMDLEHPETHSAGSLAARILVVTDPPEHGKLRALVNKGFTPRAVSRLDPYVRRVVTRLLDDVAGRRECDFAAEIAARLPFVVICELLGVPEGDRRALFQAIAPMMQTPSDQAAASTSHVPDRLVDAAGYFFGLIAERRGARRDDLVSALVGADVGGETLSDADILALCTLLFVAGSETTMNAISGGVLALIEHPDQRRRLEADSSLMATAVEEVLRWTSPVLVGMVRTATAGAEIRGVRIGRGQKVTLWYPSANRDEDMFPDPDRFDVSRGSNDHLAFGFGEHFCLGASLARLEIRVMLEEVLRRVRDLELAGPVRRLRSNIFYAVERMPVRLTVET